MSWTAPRTFVAGEVETAAIFNAHLRDNLLFLKSGVALSSTVTTNQGPTSATTELVLATSPAFTADGSTLVEIVFSWYAIAQTVSTDVFLVKLYDGTTPGSGTQLAQWLNSAAGATTSMGSGFIRAFITPSAGSHTYTARLVRSSGTGTATLTAFSTAPAVISLTQAN